MCTCNEFEEPVLHHVEEMESNGDYHCVECCVRIPEETAFLMNVVIQEHGDEPCAFAVCVDCDAAIQKAMSIARNFGLCACYTFGNGFLYLEELAKEYQGIIGFHQSRFVEVAEFIRKAKVEHG